jgi:hypothetical protein
VFGRPDTLSSSAGSTSSTAALSRKAPLNRKTVCAFDRNTDQRLVFFSLITYVLKILEEIHRCRRGNNRYDFNRPIWVSTNPSGPFSLFLIELHRREPLRKNFSRALVLDQKPYFVVPGSVFNVPRTS